MTEHRLIFQPTRGEGWVRSCICGTWKKIQPSDTLRHLTKAWSDHTRYAETGHVIPRRGGDTA